MTYRPLLLPISVLLLFITATTSFAHKLRLFAWEEQGHIISEVKFSKGRPAQQAEVTVIDRQSGEILGQGRTDSAGIFRFPTPTGGREVEIVADGGDGHLAKWQLKTTPTADIAETHPPQISQPPATRERVTANDEAAELRQLLAEVVAAELAPIHRALAEQAEASPTLQDILGGVGYILGLAGVAALIHTRRKP
jgi:nickel transport protein